MKVLFVHHNRLGESGEAAMFYFPTVLAEKGHDVMIIAKGGGNKEQFVGKAITVFEVGLEKNWLSQVSKTLRKERPEVVHVFLYSGAGLIPLLASSHCRTKFVLDIRSPLLRTGLKRVLHRVKNWFEPIGFDAITAHGIESSWTQLGKRKDVNFLPPGVNLSLVPMTQYKKNRNANDVFKLVYIGSLDKLRRPIKLIEAVISAAKVCSVELDIYGDGSEKRQLEKFISQKSAVNNIRFKGLVTRDVLFEKLVDYDLGLSYIPSGIYETAPALKTLEYLACGLPVLATNTMGNRMFITHGVNGFLADGDSFSEQIISIASLADLNDIRENTRKSVMAFDWQKITEEKLLPLYQNLIESGK